MYFILEGEVGILLP